MKNQYRLAALLMTTILFVMSGCGFTHPYTPPLANETELKTNTGKSVTIIGIASDALKAGPAVIMDEVPIYLPAMKNFPENVSGKKIQVTGKLIYVEAPPTEPGEKVSGTISGHYELQDHQWILLESLRPR